MGRTVVVLSVSQRNLRTAVLKDLRGLARALASGLANQDLPGLAYDTRELLIGYPAAFVPQAMSYPLNLHFSNTYTYNSKRTISSYSPLLY